MHNLKEIRKNFSNFEKSLIKRSLKIDFKNLQKLDEQNRDLIQKKEKKEQEKKLLSKKIDTNYPVSYLSSHSNVTIIIKE